jgi:hypothetical protein
LGSVASSGAARDFSSVEESQSTEESDSESDQQEAEGGLLPLAPDAQEAAAEEGALSELVVFPVAGAKVAGRVDLVASYSGPRPSFVSVAIDGATRAVMNIAPYGYRWDATDLVPGAHIVRVTVLGEGGTVLADQVNSYTVVAPGAQTDTEETPDL